MITPKANSEARDTHVVTITFHACEAMILYSGLCALKQHTCEEFIPRKDIEEMRLSIAAAVYESDPETAHQMFEESAEKAADYINKEMLNTPVRCHS